MEDIVIYIGFGVAGIVGGLVGYFITNWKLFQLERRIKSLENRVARTSGEWDIGQIIGCVLDGASLYLQKKEPLEIAGALNEKYPSIAGKMGGTLIKALGGFGKGANSGPVENEKW